MQARYASISKSPQTYCLYFPAWVLQFFSACARLLLIPSLRCAKLGVASADAASATASAVTSVLILIMVGLLLSFLRETSPTRDRVRRDRVNPKAAPSRGRNGPQSQRKRRRACGRSSTRRGATRHRGAPRCIAAGLPCSNSWNRRAGKPYEIVMQAAQRMAPGFGVRIGRRNLPVPQGGFEPSTYRLRSDCSAVELLRRPERVL